MVKSLNEIADDLSALLALECERLKIPGAAVGILHNGEELHVCHGVTNLDDPQDVTPETLFGIGSTSKTITGTALMALVEQGKVRLEDLVVDYLPDVPITDPEVKKTVTVGQLVDHTSGWVGDTSCNTGWGDDALARAIEEMIPPAHQLTAPGAVMSYSNSAVTLAGHLIATIEGEPFEAVATRLVLQPLGMSHTFYSPTDVVHRRTACGHLVNGDAVTAVPIWPTLRWLAPAGGAFSTTKDQIAYARFHVDGDSSGSAPITEESRQLMRTPRVTVASGIDGVGVTWLLKSYGPLKVVEHGGNLSHLHVSAFSMVPDSRFAVTTLTNSAGGSALGVLIKEKAIEWLLGVESLPALDEIEQPDLTEYVGAYEAGQWDVIVEEANGRLQLGMKVTDVSEGLSEEMIAVFEAPRTPVFFCRPDVVAPVSKPGEAHADFIRDESGKIAFVRQGMRVARRR